MPTALTALLWAIATAIGNPIPARPQATEASSGNDNVGVGVGSNKMKGKTMLDKISAAWTMIIVRVTFFSNSIVRCIEMPYSTMMGL